MVNIVSSDDDSILDYCSNYPVICVKRPSIFRSSSPTLEALNHALSSVELDFPVDAVITLQPTSHYTYFFSCKSSNFLFESSQPADSLVSCVAVPHQFTPSSLMTLNESSNRLEHFDSSKLVFRRQDKPLLYARNGAAIYISSSSILNTSILGNNIIPFVMSNYCSVDIDSYFDLSLAEFLMSSDFTDKLHP